jgi:glucokinase
MVSTVVTLIKDVMANATSEVVGVGVAAAGFIDASQSTILYSPNLKWRNEPFRDRLQVHLDVPLVIENDANAAGWAEYKFGAGLGTKDMVMLTLGTGVGGAVVADYKLRRGGFGIAGELGHVRVVQDGKQCGCGRKGCVEQYSSGTAVLKAAKKLAASSGPAGQRLRELKAEVGDLARVKRIVKLTGFVNCTDDFTAQPKVINGASDLLVAVFGEKGRHARAAVGVNALPAGAPVEIELIAEIATP